jgi:hypothetical protein
LPAYTKGFVMMKDLVFQGPVSRECTAMLTFDGPVTTAGVDRLIDHLKTMREVWADDKPADMETDEMRQFALKVAGSGRAGIFREEARLLLRLQEHEVPEQNGL